MPRLDTLPAPSIASSPTPQICEGAHHQADSPLFSTIPAEIRQKIYAFALHSSPDPSKPFHPQHHHYRPYHQHRPKYDFRLLQTCKRIYHEARLLPISVNEISIYLYQGPRSNMPPYSQYDWRSRYRDWNAEQCNAVHTVHFFAQQWHLESTPGLLEPGIPYVRPTELRGMLRPVEKQIMVAKKVIMTLRRSDWWSWESPVMSSDQLGICPWRRGRTDWREMEKESLEGPTGKWGGWGGQFQHVRGLETLVMEFETVVAKRAQLERVVERAKHWRFPLRDNKVLAWTGEVEESTWEGAVKLKEDDGDRPVQLRRVRKESEDAKPATCPYVVMTMEWRVAQREHTD